MELRQNIIQEKHSVNKRKVDFDADEKTDFEADKNPASKAKVSKKVTNSGKVSTQKAPSIHKNHRQRLKKQYFENGLSALSDIQKLELLLFFAIPQKDTNPIAHALLDEMGSLRNVFCTDVKSLMRVKGIKENSAILISLVGDMLGDVTKPRDGEKLGSTTASKEFCSKLYIGVEVEQFYVICLSRSNRVLKYKMIKAGTVDEINIQIRSITQFAIEQKCNRIVVSHNHPVGPGDMSDEDCKFTYELLCSCLLNSIEIVDHIIVGTDETVSMNRNNMLTHLREKAFDDLGIIRSRTVFPSDSYEPYIIDET